MNNRKEGPAKVISIEADQKVTDGFKQIIRRGPVTVQYEDGTTTTFFRGTGQIANDIQEGDEGTVTWIDTASAFYPVFSRNA